MGQICFHLACHLDQLVRPPVAVLRFVRTGQKLTRNACPRVGVAHAVDLQTHISNNTEAQREIVVMTYRPLGLC